MPNLNNHISNLVAKILQHKLFFPYKSTEQAAISVILKFWEIFQKKSPFDNLHR